MMRTYILTVLLSIPIVTSFSPPEIESDLTIQRDNVIGDFLEISAGDVISIRCVHSNNDELLFIYPNLTDFKDFDPNDFALRKEEQHGHVGAELTIKKAKPADTGSYICALKEEPSISTQVYVFVKENELFIPSAVSGFSVDTSDYVVPCKTSKNVLKDDVLLKVNGEVWKSASKHYDPRIGFKLTEKTAETKLSTTLMYSCIYKPTNESMQFFISPKSQIASDNITLEWGEVTDWAHIGGEFVIECMLKFPGKGVVEKHKHFINITCPRCGSSDAPRQNRLSQRYISQYININPLTAEDRGKYVCNWYYDLMERQNISREIDVSAKKGQFRIGEISPQDILVKQGHTFSIFSNITYFPSQPPTYSAAWRRVYSKPPKEETMSESIITDPLHHPESDIQGNNVKESLTIKDAAVNMSGIYVLTLQVLDTVKTIEFNVSIVSDVVKARIDISTPESYVLFDQKYYPPGKQLRVLCYAESYPLASVKLMYKLASENNGWLDVDQESLSYNEGTYETSLQWDTTIEQSIDVRCLAERQNGLQRDTDQKRIRVSDGEPSVSSTVIKSETATALEDSKAIYEGDTVVFNCTFPADPSWSSSWLFDGSVIPRTELFHETISQIHVATIRNISASAAGEYLCVLNNSEKEKILKVKIDVMKTMKPFLTGSDHESPTTLVYGTERTLHCHVSGVPKPQISWFKENKPYSGGILQDDNKTLHIARVATEDQGEFVCKAENRAGTVESRIVTTVAGGPKKTLGIWLTLLILAVLVLLFYLFGFMFLAFKQRKTNKEQERALSVLYEQLMRENNAPPTVGPKLPIDQRVGDLPYNREFEIDGDMLHIENRIGTGQFGQVWKGFISLSQVSDACHEGKKIPVAIKGPLNGKNPTHQKMLADELKIMCAIGRHPNVLSLLGAVTKKMKSGELFVVVELCEKGNLKDYLLKRKACFIDELRQVEPIDDGYVAPNNAYRSKYACELDVDWSDEAEKERLLPDSITLTTSDLLSYGMQVANGMDYLSSIPCIHRDLAARNVLLTENGICRIADFGMARNENKEYYRLRKGKHIPVPYRWMSIEAIEDGLYTQESDVWSYGILLYEIFTLSGLPYPTTANEELLEKLKSGHRNPKPAYCPEEIYDLMKQCWSVDSSARPSFGKCVQVLKTHLSRASPQLLVRVETEIVKEVAKQNSISRILRPEQDYREQARNGLSRQLETSETAAPEEHIYLQSTDQHVV